MISYWLMKFGNFLKNRQFHLIIVILVSILTYVNILQNGFAWDDRDFFIDWPQIKNTEGLPAYLSIPALMAGDLPLNHRGIYRPVRSIYYLASYAIWGENPLGYHIQAIIVHALIVLLIYMITEIITKKRIVALIVALLFATHPIHTEAVTYITASMDTLGILFFFLSFYFYLKTKTEKSKKSIFLLASLIYSFFAFFTYEMTLVLPFLIVSYDLSMNNFSFKRIISKINVYKYYFLGFAAYFLVRFLILGIGNRADYLGGNWEIAANQTRIVIPEIFAHYFWWLIWPVNLTISHDLTINLLLAFIKILNKIDPTGNLVNMSTKIAFLFPVFYFLLSLLILYKLFKKYPLIFYSTAWIIIALLPVSNIIPQGASIAERFLFIPSYGFILLVGLLFYHGFIKLKENKQKIYRYSSYGIILTFILTTLFYMFQTFRRNIDWKNEKTIWLSAISVDPTSPRAYAALGVIYTREGQYDNGINLFKKAIDLNQPSAKLNSDLGLIYEKKGDIEKAVMQYQEALKINPDYYLAHIYLGNIYLQRQNDFKSAEQEYKSALEIKKKDPVILSYLGNVYYNQEQFDQALKIYLEALNLEPNSDILNYKVGFAYFRLSSYELAIKFFNKSLDLNPNQPLVYLGLASSFEQKGDTEKAREILEKGFIATHDQQLKEELRK